MRSVLLPFPGAVLDHRLQLLSGPPHRMIHLRLQLHQELEQDLPTLILALPESYQEAWLSRWRDPQDTLFHPITPVDGTTLQREVGMSPGPALGRLLRHLKQELAFGRINGHDEAIREAQRFVSRDGSSL